jgi:hypothetical protein
MEAGQVTDKAVAVLEQLRDEFGSEGAGEVELTSKGARPALGAEERELAERVRESLARLASAAWETSTRDPDVWERRALQAALDGAELVWGSEIAAGREERLAQYLPGLVFVTLLLALDHDGALRASQRASELAIALGLPGA